MKTGKEQPEYPTPGEIAVCAYFIWKNEGCPEGTDQENWRQAEMQLCMDRVQDCVLANAGENL